MLNITLVGKHLFLDIIPQVQRLEVTHQVIIYLQKLTIQSRAAKDLCKLRIDAWRGTSNVADVSGWRDSHQCRIAHALLDFHPKRIPVEARLVVNFHLYLAVSRQRLQGVDW